MTPDSGSCYVIPDTINKVYEHRVPKLGVKASSTMGPRLSLTFRHLVMPS